MSVWVNSNECGRKSQALLGRQRRHSERHNASVTQQVPEFTQVNNCGWQQTRKHVQDTEGRTEPGLQIDSFLCNCATWFRSAAPLQLQPAVTCTETASPSPSSSHFSILPLNFRADSSSVQHFKTVLHFLCTFFFADTHTPDCISLTLIRLVCWFTHFPDRVQVSRDDESCRPTQRSSAEDDRLCGRKT